MARIERGEGAEMSEGLFHPFGDRFAVPLPEGMLGACADRGTPCEVLGGSGLCERCAEREVFVEPEPEDEAVYWPAW